MTRPDFTKRHVLRSGSFVVGGGILSTVLAAVLTTILGVELGDDGFGAYAFVIATAGLFASIARFGLSPIVVRDIARSVTEESPLGSRTPVTTALSIITPASALIALLIVSPPGQALFEATGDLSTTMVGAMAVIFLGQAFFTINAESLRGLHHHAGASFVGLPIQRLVALVLVAFAVYVLGAEFDPAMAAWLTGVAAIAALVVSAAVLWGRVRRLPGERPTKLSAVRMARAGAPVLLTNVLGFAAVRLPVWVLPVLSDLGEAGVFALATAYVTLIRFGHKTMTQTLSPYIAESYLKGSPSDLQRRIRVAAAATTLVALAASVVLVVAGTLIVPRLFPAGFADSVAVAAILLVGTVAVAAAGPSGLLLNVSGNERRMARASSISIALAVAAVGPAAAAGGAIGTAIVMASTTIVRVLLQLRYAKQQTGILTTADFGALLRSVRRAR